MGLPILLLLLMAGENKRAINNDYSVSVSFGDSPCVVRVVYGSSNQTYITLDRIPACDIPSITRATEQAVYIDWFGDYGFYRGTYKYVYDLPKRHAATRYEYHRFAVESVHSSREAVMFFGKYNERAVALVHREGRWTMREGLVTAGEEAPPVVPPRILQAVHDPDPHRYVPPDPGRFRRIPGGGWLYVPPSHVPGRERPTAGVHVISAAGKAAFYPVPVPTLDRYETLRAKPGNVNFLPGPPDTLENFIGPFAFDGERVWFANGFYDGEGISGVGAIGSFDVRTRKYEIRHLPEIAPWSASAVLLDGSDLWIALMRQPEGAAYGAGVLRYDTATGALQKYAINDYVSTITRNGATIYFATVHGVYTVEDDGRLTHIRIEPGRTGKPVVIAIKP